MCGDRMIRDGCSVKLKGLLKGLTCRVITRG